MNDFMQRMTIAFLVNFIKMFVEKTKAYLKGHNISDCPYCGANLYVGNPHTFRCEISVAEGLLGIYIKGLKE